MTHQHHDTKKESSLNNLNDDVLLEIIAVVKQLSTAEERQDRFCANYENQQLVSEEVPGDQHAIVSRSRFGSRILKIVAAVKRSSTTSTATNQQQKGDPKPSSQENCAVKDGIAPYGPSSQLFGPLQALSMTNKRFRYLTANIVYRSITIGPEVCWEDALQKLDVIAKCDAVRANTRIFMMDLSIGPAPLGLNHLEYKGPTPPKRFAPVLLEILSKLTNLQKLMLIIPDHHTDIFKRTFQTSDNSFESVRKLVLGPHMEWIIAKCPNAETISTRDWRWLHSNVNGKHDHQHSTNLIKAAGRAKHLRHFELINRWTHGQLQAVFQAMPQIHTLAMPGGLHYKESLEDFLSTLRLFENLKVLAFDGLRNLNVGFDPPWCGNAYMGPNGHLVRERVDREELEGKKRVADMVFATLSKLEELWVGDCSRATVASTKFGKEIDWTDMPRPRPYKDRWDLWED
ncbi:MAG: hypothetical protein LQ337_001515 [Flavoplaca oasis]|nr:MAG: hypothetical protein LQ337_001515 [Flavoplaca oasis]